MSLKSVILAGGLLMAGAGIANAAVATADVNMRSGPGTGYGVVTVVPAGASLAIVDCNGAWCRVDAGGAQGYVNASYLANEGGGAYVAPVYAGPVVTYGFGFGPRWYGGYRGYGWRGHGWRGGGGHWHGHHR